jgi:hypothetical protein
VVPPIGEHHILKHYAGYHYHSGRKTRLSRYFLAAEQLIATSLCAGSAVSKYGVDRLVVPQKYKEETMSLSHDLVCTGHQGVQRTRERIKARYYWYRMQ